jgi:hypothetical protein
VVPGGGIELEPLCERERSGSSQAKIPSVVEGPFIHCWCREGESNLSRFVSVSEAGAHRRNPERSRGTVHPLLVPGGGIEPPQAFWALRILSPLRLPISPSRPEL